MATLRGHADSVNDAAFLPFSNTLATCSADKSVSLWDIRTASASNYVYSDNYYDNNCRGSVSTRSMATSMPVQLCALHFR